MHSALEGANAEVRLGQLAAQMEALKKQARQAVRYRNVSAQVRKAEATLYHLRWTAFYLVALNKVHQRTIFK